MIYQTLPRIDFEAVIVHCIMANGKFPILRKKYDHPYYPGLWGFPAGKVKTGETLIQAGEREVLEETGNDVTGLVVSLELSPSLTIHNHHRTGDPIFFSATILFCAKMLGNIVIDPQEHQDVALVSYDDIVAKKFVLIPDAFEDFVRSMKAIKNIR